MNQLNSTTSQIKEDSKHLALVGRQSIYDQRLDVYGYELLYRSLPGQNFAPSNLDGDLATSQVMLNTFFEIGLENIVANKFAFINLTGSFIDGSINLPLSQRNVVLEILESVQPETEILQGLESLKNNGYLIALDDYNFDRRSDPFLKFVDIIKVDLMLSNRVELTQQVEVLRKSYQARLLAEKIETLEDFEFCKSLGFDLFQGYFLEKPVLVKGKKMPANKLAILQLLSRLQDPHIEVNELESLIKNDVALSYKVLRYVNSPAIGLRSEVSNIKQAIVLLGLNSLKRWVSLIVIAGVCEKSMDLIRLSLVRAKMCESIALGAKLENIEECFMLGLFSLLDSIMDLSIEEVLMPIPLPKSVKDALIFSKGKLGVILAKVKAFEKGEWDSLVQNPAEAQFLGRKYLDSVSWAEGTISGVTN